MMISLSRSLSFSPSGSHRIDRHNNINITRYSYQVVNAFFGFGNQFFLGLGGAVFIRSYSLSVRVKTISRPTRFTYTVAGMGVTSSGAKGQNIVLTKGGRTEYIWDKKDGTVTKISSGKTQKTLAPTKAPGTKKGRQRKALARKAIGAWWA